MKITDRGMAVEMALGFKRKNASMERSNISEGKQNKTNRRFDQDSQSSWEPVTNHWGD